jgi:hypothetical protein
MAKKAKKISEKIDGLGPDDIKKIRSALRQVWNWSHPRKLVIKRCLRPDGFSNCEGCKKIVAKIYVDHIKNVGDVDEGFIKRLWTPSKNLQGLCKPCHDKKTAAERKRIRDAEKGFM